VEVKSVRREKDKKQEGVTKLTNTKIALLPGKKAVKTAIL